jgi:AAA15 family ATPase/GTPase
MFELDMESSGTIRYFSFIQNILNIIENGGVFIVDEMSARLHPVLTKFIVDLFQGEKNQEAQFIFTTHDISLMNRKQLRRDEIAFVEKNERGESSLYTLADIKARSDASFSKDYMSGKYGAIPMINEAKIKEEMAGEISCQD